MKLHKIVLLASLSILPIQQSFAATANRAELAQPTSSKATMVMQAKKVVKPNKVITGNKGIRTVAGPGGTAVQHNQTSTRVENNLIAKMGKNLKLLYLEWDDEVCARPQLRDDGMGYATCDLAFQVTNTGYERIDSFNVRLLRTTLSGNVTPLDIQSGLYKLAPHERKIFKIRPESLGLFKIGRPFTLTLDHRNEIAETNENDNTATFLAPY